MFIQTMYLANNYTKPLLAYWFLTFNLWYSIFFFAIILIKIKKFSFQVQHVKLLNLTTFCFYLRTFFVNSLIRYSRKALSFCASWSPSKNIPLLCLSSKNPLHSDSFRHILNCFFLSFFLISPLVCSRNKKTETVAF